jgi:calcium-dependent protein kinase
MGEAISVQNGTFLPSPKLNPIIPASCREPLSSHFELSSVLGSGHFGVVRKARRLHVSSPQGKWFAVKSLEKAPLSDTCELIRSEIRTLRNLDHPNVVRLYEVYDNAQHIHMVTELCGGGSLQEHLDKFGRISEQQTRQILRQLLSAIQYLHKQDIVHRDIKLSNVLFSSSASDATVKLIDFGLAEKILDGEVKNLSKYAGTAQYVAPEVVAGKYGKACDLWSLAVLMYVML